MQLILSTCNYICMYSPYNSRFWQCGAQYEKSVQDELSSNFSWRPTAPVFDGRGSGRTSKHIITCYTKISPEIGVTAGKSDADSSTPTIENTSGLSEFEEECQFAWQRFLVSSLIA